MKFLNKLERRFGRFAIPNLMIYVVALYILGFVMSFLPYNISSLLQLDFDLVRAGQIWRLVTFLIPAASSNLIYLIIMVYFYYMIGNALESNWGSFRLNLYFFSGIVFNVIAAFITYLITGYSISPSLDFVCGTLFFAFAALYPNSIFYFYFIIPIKAKYLAIFRGLVYIYEIYTYIVYRQYFLIIPLVVSLANFLIFFFATRNYRRISPSEIKRKADFRKQMRNPANHGTVSQFRGRNVVTRHKCAVCGRTELDGDQLEFRFCSKCDGNYEYCMEHLFTHEHVHKS